jgi:signal transduction histidine kinase/DNA-binding NarL/FixJ family response regulator/HPt (histidine-containing phosphotransfer) domain-containing protein
MTIRVKIIITIVLTSVVIVFFGLFTGFTYSQTNLDNTISSNLETVADIADNYVTAEIDLLKNDAAEVARNVASKPDDKQREQALVGQIASVRENNFCFISLSVYDRSGQLKYASGITTPPENILSVADVQKAYTGEAVLSTTVPDDKQKLVIYVCVPLGNDILAAAIPGNYFSELLKSYVIWQSGHIFIDDAEGTIIANPREDWVFERYNFIKMSEDDPSYEDVAATVKRAIQGESGVAEFSINGVPRYCAFKPITGSKVGWVLGVIAPASESPARDQSRSLMLVGLICLVLSVIAAFISGRFIEKPYNEIKQLREEAQHESAAKTNFLANMSHEMRTPLNAVIGLSELMIGDDTLDEAHKESTEKIHAAGLTLLGIVNDILDMSKVESGQFELIADEYDTPSLINDTVTLNIMRIESKPVEFRLHVDENLPCRLFGDELRVKQIFNNILSNAFKYTREGVVDWTIGFDIETSAEGEKKFFLVSEVKDTGIGIKEEDQSRIFGEYNQVNTKANRKIEGTGLGLTITKKMLERMGGSITFESTYRVGSTFIIRIPQQMVQSAPIGREVVERLAHFVYSDAKGRHGDKLMRVKMPYARVLVVDDVPTNLDVARGILKPYDMQVDCVLSGQAAIDLIKRANPKYDAILMDHMMPGMDGVEAVQHIRNDIDSDYARNVPILALTANAIKGNEELFLTNGFQAFLTKPIDLTAMDAALRKWVRNRNKEAEMKAGEEADVNEEISSGLQTIPAVFPIISGLDMHAGLELFSGDEEMYIEVLKSFAETTPDLLNSVRSFDEAETDNYAIIVHGIKSSSRSIGAIYLSQQAEDLEKAAKAHELYYIERNHDAFIADADALVNALQDALKDMMAANPKPTRDKADTDTLRALLEASKAFDVDGVDDIMVELNKYKYEDPAAEGLVEWLKDQVKNSGFKNIAEELSSILG